MSGNYALLFNSVGEGAGPTLSTRVFNWKESSNSSMTTWIMIDLGKMWSQPFDETFRFYFIGVVQNRKVIWTFISVLQYNAYVFRSAKQAGRQTTRVLELFWEKYNEKFWCNEFQRSCCQIPAKKVARVDVTIRVDPQITCINKGLHLAEWRLPLGNQPMINLNTHESCVVVDH